MMNWLHAKHRIRQSLRQLPVAESAARNTPVLIALLLIITGLLKFHLVVSQPPVDAGILSSRWVLIATVQLEWALAAWLLIGVKRPTAWRVLVGVFSCFLLISIAQTFRGEHCHCFGVITVPPGFSLLVDLAVLCLLFYSKQVWRHSQSQLRGRMVTGAVAMFVLSSSAAAAYALTHQESQITSSSGLTIGHGRNVLLEPEHWLGERLPLLDFVENEEMLSRGEWEVWIYRHDCPECKRALRSLEMRKQETPLAIIELPPFAVGSDEHHKVDAQWTQVDARYSWFGETPIQLHLNAGVVIQVADTENH